MYIKGYLIAKARDTDKSGTEFAYIVMWIFMCMLILYLGADSKEYGYFYWAGIAVVTLGVLMLIHNSGTKRQIKGTEEKFYDAVNEEIKKLEDEIRHDELLSGLKFMGATTIGVMAGLVTGHLGAAIAAAKLVSGEGVTAANLVSAATGVGGLSELADAADIADAIDTAGTADAINTANDATNAFSHVSDTHAYSGEITVDTAGHIMDEHNLILGRFDGQHIFDSSNSITGTINGNHLLGSNGDIIGTISGDKIMGSHGDIMYRVDISGNVFDNHNMIIGKIS